MKLTTRRWLLGLGAGLLVGGWGLTDYAEEQQEAVPASKYDARILLWQGGGAELGFGDMGFLPPSRAYYGAGVAAMAIGAGLLGTGWIRSEGP